MTAYVSVLCNFAELYELTGELNHKEEYLSAALAVIKNYEAQIHSDNNASEQKTRPFPLSQVLHKPVLGRVLTLVAHRELSVGQTVVAEGLYRSAIDNLSSPAALHDPRYNTKFSLKTCCLIILALDNKRWSILECSPLFIKLVPCYYQFNNT